MPSYKQETKWLWGMKQAFPEFIVHQPTSKNALFVVLAVSF